MEQLLLASKLPTTLTVDLRLGELNAITKNRVIKALEDGVLFSSMGVASQVYEALAWKYDVPTIKVRKQARFNEGGCWGVYLRGGARLDNTKMQEVITADRVAARMAGHPMHIVGHSAQLEWSTHEFAWQRLFALRQEEAMREAARARLTPEIRARAALAIEEIKQGNVVRFTY